VFLELPKYAAGHDPQTHVDKWAYFFREAGKLIAIPEALREPSILDALEGARTARFNRQEWDAYIAASMAIQNERGALAFARREGELTGETAANARAVLTVLRVRGIAVPETARADPGGEGFGAARALAGEGHGRRVGRRGDRRPELTSARVDERLPRTAGLPT